MPRFVRPSWCALALDHGSNNPRTVKATGPRSRSGSLSCSFKVRDRGAVVQYMPGGGRDTARDAAGRARAMLLDYEGDSPEWSHPPAWLSAEWADEPTTRDVAEACGVDTDRDPDGTVAQEVCDAFVAAADAAWLGFILRHLRHVAKGDA